MPSVRRHAVVPGGFLTECKEEHPRSDDKAEHKQLDRQAAWCGHPTLDRNGTNGYRRRFKRMACRTIWSGPLATEDESTEDDCTQGIVLSYLTSALKAG